MERIRHHKQVYYIQVIKTSQLHYLHWEPINKLLIITHFLITFHIYVELLHLCLIASLLGVYQQKSNLYALFKHVLFKCISTS